MARKGRFLHPQEEPEDGRDDAPAKTRGEKRTFFEFFLCLSRACLGKMFAFISKWLQVRFAPEFGRDADEAV